MTSITPPILNSGMKKYIPHGELMVWVRYVERRRMTVLETHLIIGILDLCGEPKIEFG